MFRRLISAAAIITLLFAAPVPSMAQSTAGQDAKKAGEEAKEAGKAAGEATKDAAKATGKTAKKAAKKTEQGAKKAGTAVKDAVAPEAIKVTCNDGTVQSGKTKTAACEDHGGAKN